MSYKVHITKTAERDLVGAMDYIEYTLKNPAAAESLLVLAEERFSELSEFTDSHPIVDDSILSAWGIRFVVVNNYLGFYNVTGDYVYILRFLYGKRDWISILKQDFKLE